MLDRDSEDEISSREISTRRRPTKSYISPDEESDDDEEDDEEEEEKVKARRVSDDTLEKTNDEEADESKDATNGDEGGRMLRKGRKRAEVAEEEMEDNEQPKRSHKRMEVEPMPEAEVVSVCLLYFYFENVIALNHFKVFSVNKFETV